MLHSRIYNYLYLCAIISSWALPLLTLFCLNLSAVNEVLLPLSSSSPSINIHWSTAAAFSYFRDYFFTTLSHKCEIFTKYFIYLLNIPIIRCSPCSLYTIQTSLYGERESMCTPGYNGQRDEVPPKLT